MLPALLAVLASRFTLQQNVPDVFLYRIVHKTAQINSLLLLAYTTYTFYEPLIIIFVFEHLLYYIGIPSIPHFRN
uniref:Putative secreted peptide n=1 Tax=Anopheles braziliensis TaxID=58242 RepID=A0A2M3ZS49_9DIPT